MWNLGLEQELILIVAIIATIAWLMGRSVCTSGEYQERSKLKMLKKEQQHLESVLTQKNQNIQDVNQRFSEVEQGYKIKSSSLDSLEKEHKRVLNDLQSMKNCHVELETLSKHYNKQSIEYIDLKDSSTRLQEKLSHIQISSKKQENELIKHKVENKQLALDYAEQVARNNALTISLNDTKQELITSVNLTEIQKNDLEQCEYKNNELYQEVQTYKILSTIS